MADQSWVPYCGAAPQPNDWMAQWNLDPLLIALMAIVGLWALARSNARAAFLVGYGALFLLFISPLCALTSALFSVRVAHHIVLTAVIAPLLIWGLPHLRLRGSAALWTGVHIFLFWLWHAPQPYALALSHDGVFWLMQIGLLGSAMAFWSAIRRCSAVWSVSLLLIMMVQMGLLGALLTFAGDALYQPHYVTSFAWGYTPLEDQQLAGLIMWAPASALYLGAALIRGWRMFNIDPVPA